MRIITGKYRGKNINPPSNLPVRPTTDFAKESLFNILGNVMDFEGMDILDLFAGTGSITYEFFSRGAASVTSVDSSAKCIAFIDRTADSMTGGEVIKTRHEDVFRFLKHHPGPYDIVFADPPYDLPDLNTLPGIVMQGSILKPEGLFILEHSKNHDFRTDPLITDFRQYGNVRFSFFTQKSSE